MSAEAATATQAVVMNSTFWIATGIFIAAYAIIVSEKIHKTIIGMFGAALMIVVGIVTQEERLPFHRSRGGLERDLPAGQHDGYHQYHEAHRRL